MSKKPTVFISYRRSNAKELARYLHDKLVDLGADVFLDVEALNAGRFSTIIQREIINRDHFIILLKPETLDSEWVRRELLLALEHRRNIIPITSDGFSFEQHIPTEVEELKQYSGIPYYDHFAEETVNRVAKAIGISPKQRTNDKKQIKFHKIASKSHRQINDAVIAAIIVGIFTIIAAIVTGLCGLIPSFLQSIQPPTPITTYTYTPSEVIAATTLQTNTTMTVYAPVPTNTATSTPTGHDNLLTQTAVEVYVEMTVGSVFIARTGTAEEISISTYTAMTVDAIRTQTATIQPTTPS